nr:hypothetical protein [Tanacetum cinerariifolium]
MVNAASDMGQQTRLDLEWNCFSQQFIIIDFMARFWRFIEDVITKMIDYHLFDVVVEFHRFGGNDESKKMQKYLLKQQFEGFSVSTSEGLHKGNQDNRRRDVGYNGNKARDNVRRPAYQDDSKALVTIDGEDIDWSGHVEENAQNYAMMAYSFSNSGSDNESVFMNKESDLENTFVNDRYADGMHVVPPPMIGNYMPSGPDVEIDYSKFTYGPKQTSIDESDSKPNEYASCESDSSVETTTSMRAPIENEPNVVCEPKVWTDAPIIEEENVKETGTSNHNPKIEKQGENGRTIKGLGYAFTRKSCFVRGSFSHLIRDCDFHEKRMAKQAELIKSKNKVTGQREIYQYGTIKELASPKQTALDKDISNPFMAGSLPKTKWVLALEQSKTAQDLVIKKLQKKVKRIERKIKARTPGMTLFKIGNFRRKSLDKVNVSKQGRYLKTRPMFEESNFDNIDDMVNEDND